MGERRKWAPRRPAGAQYEEAAERPEGGKILIEVHEEQYYTVHEVQ